MAHVMLPCDLPWWTSLQRHLKHLQLASSTEKLTSGMLKIHDMCNISLDPDEDNRDADLFKGLANFLENDLSNEERLHFMDNTLRNLISRALELKHWKPANGLVFSLQQQSDLTELDSNFASSLIAHAFFSTYPKRTMKTHPTLQDFNFSYFFKSLHRKYQKAKLRSLLRYIDWLEHNPSSEKIKISRQVMSSKQWLTIEDWLECSLPLCKLQIRHEGRMERYDTEAIHICFSSARLGGNVLSNGESQESLMMFMMPELLCTMLSVEALEDNEILRMEGARVFARLSDKHKDNIEILETPLDVTMCFMDAENYSKVPESQYEEDEILRELNKCLLALQQRPLRPPDPHNKSHERRLSPIGESFNHSLPEVETTVVIKQTSLTSTIASTNSRTPSPEAYSASVLNLNDPSIELSKKKCWLSPDNNNEINRRGRFIVLGSSGECLPVTRSPLLSGDFNNDDCDSLYSSCNSTDDGEYHSANDSFDYDSEDEGRGASNRPILQLHGRVRRSLQSGQYSRELSTEARRMSFATRLKDALRREVKDSFNSNTDTTTDTWSTDSDSYAVGISVAGAGVNDNDIRVKRGGSVGFVLTGKDGCEDVLSNRLKETRGRYGRRDNADSSNYSFSTEYSSELEEIYEQFNQWLDDPIVEAGGKPRAKELDSRDVAVIRFASSLLKRTLSDSYAGTPLTEGCATDVGMEPNVPAGQLRRESPRKHYHHHGFISMARSMSLELARHKHRLAAQLLSQLALKVVSGSSMKPVVTGNWGCGSRQKGDPQIKLVLQWLAASVAGVPALVYYTAGNKKLYKLDTLVRVLVDRKWTVGELTSATLRYAQQRINEPHRIPDNHTLFEELIGIERYSDD